MYYFNSRDSFFKYPFGAVASDKIIYFTVASDMEIQPPFLCIKKDGGCEEHVSMQLVYAPDGTKHFKACYKPSSEGLYFYCFKFDGGKYGIYNAGKGIGKITANGDWFIQTVYAENFVTPDRFKGGVRYQIFPDRFYESQPKEKLSFPDRVYRKDKHNAPFFKWSENEEQRINTDYYGGDIKGIMLKLDYLKSLGVSCIYLNPIFEAHSNHRYNTANYMKIDPDLGTVEDFRQLCENAHNMGISIILDGVFSHTGSDSIYFNKNKRYGEGGAYNDPNDKYRQWYDFAPTYKNGYRAWWDFDSLPEVNESEKSYIDFICGVNGVIDYWLSNGADGFRLDVADELPDEFIEQIRKAVKRRGTDKLLIGEVWEDAVTKISFNKRRTYLLGKGLDSTMNYPFRVAVLDFVRNGDGEKFCERVFSIYENYPKEALDNAWNNISTHDTPRAITFLRGADREGSDRYWQSRQHLTDEEYNNGKKLLICAYALTFALPGVPCIYYGDEIGMQGYRDPFNREYFKWWRQDEYILENIRRISNFRISHSQYKKGGLHFAYISYNTVAFVRYDEGSEVLTAVNRGDYDENFNYNGTNYTVNAKSYINLQVR